MRLKLHCTCGASCITVASVDALDKIRRAWDEVHSGEGHSPCTVEQARAAKRKRDSNDR